MIKYRTEETTFGVTAKITPVDVESETETSVWVKGRRQNKVSSRGTYHDTWDAAHAHLLSEAGRQLTAATRQLERETDALRNVRGMKRPEDDNGA